MRAFNDPGRRIAAAALTFTCVGAMLLSGCSSAPTAAPHKPALLEVDQDVGFTITEAARITSDVRADYYEALRLLNQQRYDQGVAAMLEVTRKAPDLTAPHVDLGIAYSRAGEFDKAQESLLRALSLTPRHPIAHNELGIVYRKTGRFAHARASYERALAVHSGFHFARRNLGVLCDLYLGDLQCALEHYEIYNESVPEDQEVVMWLADIRTRLGREQAP
jgi:tetratricopeptide (TPR) repeat protein